MLLHTIADPKMIFPPKYSDVKYYKLKHGYAECEVTDSGNVIRSINSTNLSDYLNCNYSIGKILK